MTTDFGVAIPSCAEFEKVLETRSFMDQFEDDREYFISRLVRLNVSLNVDFQMFNMAESAGFNKSKTASSNSPVNEYSFLYEERMFQIKMANFKDYHENKDITFTNDFVSAVNDLPKSYDKDDPANKDEFERFFNQFGHFIVTAAYGGGSIETKVSVQQHGSDAMSFEEVKACLMGHFCGGFRNVGGDVLGDYLSKTKAKLKTMLSQIQTQFKGGRKDLHMTDTIKDQDKLSKWKLSLGQDPAMLATEMCLEPISTVISCLNHKKETASYDALKDLLGGQFKLLAIVEREKTKSQAEEIKMQVEQAKRAAEEWRRQAELYMKQDIAKESRILEELSKRQVPYALQACLQNVETLRQVNKVNTREEAVQPPDPPRENCFPSNTTVCMKDVNGNIKKKQMGELLIGDRVQACDTKCRRVIYSKVIMFAHRDPSVKQVNYLKIVLEDASSIVLSSNHLIMSGERMKATMARNIEVDHVLFTINEEGVISSKKVVAIEKIIDSGVFCPITKEGNVVVNNILASCYASVNDQAFLHGLIKVSAQNVAHLGLLPMRVLHKFRVKWVGQSAGKGEFVHPYVRWLCKLKLPWMDGELDLPPVS